jgi:hypothetical protein
MGEMKPAKRAARGSQHGGDIAKKLLGGVMIIIESRGIAYAPPPPPVLDPRVANARVS